MADLVDRQAVLEELVKVVTEDFPTGGAVEQITALVIEKAIVRVQGLASKGLTATGPDHQVSP